MKGEWIVGNGHGGRELLLFFNGWGQDRKTAELFRACFPDPSGPDLAVLFDYRDLLLPEAIAAAASRYSHVDVVAWSLGVWAAQQVDLPVVRRAVAINGTGFPIDEARGIPPTVFHATGAQWSDQSRSRFERRMLAGDDREDRFMSVRSGRSGASQLQELQALSGAVASRRDATSAWRYSVAVIGGRDLVFPPASQRLAWAGTAMLEIPDMPHFPFFHLDAWKGVLE